MMPPRGPTFLSIPIDVQTQRADLDVTPPRWPSDQVRPPRQALLDAAGVLAAARNPGVLVGSRVAEAGAVAELVAVAEQLGGHGDPRGQHLARPLQLSLPPSPGRAALALLVAGGPRAAGRVRRAAGGGHEAHAAVHLSRAGLSASGARPPRADRRQPLGIGQELSRRGRAGRTSQGGAGRAGRVAGGADDARADGGGPRPRRPRAGSRTTSNEPPCGARRKAVSTPGRWRP